MEHRSKEAIRAGARRGAKKLASAKRQTRRVQVSSALRENGGLMNIRELAVATGRTAAVVRAALAERIEEGLVEKVGKQYRAVAASSKEVGGDGESS